MIMVQQRSWRCWKIVQLTWGDELAWQFENSLLSKAGEKGWTWLAASMSPWLKVYLKYQSPSSPLVHRLIILHHILLTTRKCYASVLTHWWWAWSLDASAWQSCWPGCGMWCEFWRVEAGMVLHPLAWAWVCRWSCEQLDTVSVSLHDHQREVLPSNRHKDGHPIGL